MIYHHVVPRDLFNEGNLLKCLGKLTLYIQDGCLPRLQLAESALASGFKIEQNEATGGIFCRNYLLVGHLYNDRLPVFHERPLNSRDPWPLFLYIEDQGFQVFNDDGTLTEEMEVFK